jgi:glycosyltransferase involved in cell wall biosynthesis
MNSPPFFSVITPTHNRAAMIPRVLTSIARQNFDDWEVIVLDDAGSDGDATRAAVEGMGDARFRYLRHAVNKGVCAARNTAIEASRGQWMLIVDSDFELLSGAMETLHARCREADSRVGNIISVMGWDNGPETPLPMPTHEMRIDYEGYIRWHGALRSSEYFNCIRREVFHTVKYPSGRAYEAEFNLNLAKYFDYFFVLERACLAHTDARDRITRGPAIQRAKRMLRDAPDWSASVENILRDHGETLHRVLPQSYDLQCVQLANLLLLKGDRIGALKALHRANSRVAMRPRTALITALGLLDRRLLAMAQGVRS